MVTCEVLRERVLEGTALNFSAPVAALFGHIRGTRGEDRGGKQGDRVEVRRDSEGSCVLEATYFTCA